MDYRKWRFEKNILNFTKIRGLKYILLNLPFPKNYNTPKKKEG